MTTKGRCGMGGENRAALTFLMQQADRPACTYTQRGGWGAWPSIAVHALGLLVLSRLVVHSLPPAPPGSVPIAMVFAPGVSAPLRPAFNPPPAAAPHFLPVPPEARPVPLPHMALPVLAPRQSQPLAATLPATVARPLRQQIARPVRQDVLWKLRRESVRPLVQPAPVTAGHPAAPLAADRGASGLPRAAAPPPVPHVPADGVLLAGFTTLVQQAVQQATVYPAMALRSRAQGRVQLRFAYAQGNVSGVFILTPSQSPLLDRAAMSAVSRAHYPDPPAAISNRMLQLVVWVDFHLRTDG